MWWDKSDRAAHAWLGHRRVAWRESLGAPIQKASVADCNAGLKVLNSWSAKAPRRRLNFLLESALCPVYGVAPIDGVADRTEAEVVLRAHLRGLAPSPEDWVPRVAQWPSAGGKWLVCLVRQSLLTSLDQAFGQRMVSLRPWWAWMLDTGHAHCAAFDGESLTHWQVTSGSGQQVAGTLQLDGGVEQARRWLRRHEVTQGALSSPALWLDFGGLHAASSVRVDASGFAFPEWIGHVAASA